MTRIVPVLSLLLVSSMAAAQSADLILGTWQLNVAKSTFAPGPTPKRAVRTYAVDGRVIKARGKTTDAAGEVSTTSWTVTYDGTEQSINGDPDADAQILTRVDQFTTNGTIKLRGKVVGSITHVIAKDGNTMTITYKGTNAAGQQLRQVSVYERVHLSDERTVQGGR